MLSRYQSTLKQSEMKRHKSHKNFHTRLEQFTPLQLPSSGVIGYRHHSNSKSKSRNKLIESKLFKQAKLKDDYLTNYNTKSSLSPRSSKISNFVSDGTSSLPLQKCTPKKSLKNLQINNVVSYVIKPEKRESNGHETVIHQNISDQSSLLSNLNNHQLTNLIDSYTIKISAKQGQQKNRQRVTQVQEEPFEESESLILKNQNVQLAIESDIFDVETKSNNVRKGDKQVKNIVPHNTHYNNHVKQLKAAPMLNKQLKQTQANGKIKDLKYTNKAQK